MFAGVLLVVTMAVAAVPDAGAARVDVKRIFDDLFARDRAEMAAARAKEVEALRAAMKDALPADRPLYELTLKLMQSDEPPEKLFPELLALLRQITPRARGDWETERAIGRAWLSMPTTCRAMGMDPAPVQREAMAYLRDVVTRYPQQGRAHGLLASALLESGAEPKEALPELKRCAELDPEAWCKGMHAKIIEELERPRCSGATMTRPLTAWRAKEWSAGATGRVVEQNGQKLVLEGEPFLRAADFSSVAMDGEGNLALELGASATQRFSDETGRLGSVGGWMALLLGDEVLLAARVMERIPKGKISVWMGNKKGVTLESLCGRLERPKVSESLKLK
jgi:hypothetical protein